MIKSKRTVSYFHVRYHIQGEKEVGSTSTLIFRILPLVDVQDKKGKFLELQVIYEINVMMIQNTRG